MTSARTGSEFAGARPAVHELQEIAQNAALSPRRRRDRPSRAARLQLIDILSRWGGSGLALIAGISVFVAISVGRAYPFRALVWTALVLAALFVARRLLKAFRSGERSSARPFRWRANYTSALSVLSAAFGAGALILLPEGAPTGLAFQTLALLIAASLGAGVVHAAHGRTAATACAPASVFIFWGAWQAGGPEMALWGVGSAIMTGAASLFFFHRFLRLRAVRRFPRTTFVRREFGAGDSTDARNTLMAPATQAS